MNFVRAGVFGADVSMYQDSNSTPQQIDFSKMVGQGASFVIVRAGQNLWTDPDFQINWRNARVVGLPRGAYWFYDSRVAPEPQAELFASLFAADKPELELWLDLENLPAGIPPGPYTGHAYWRKFIDRLRALLPSVRVGIYTGYYYMLGKIPLTEYAYFRQFPLWIAWYTSDPLDVRTPGPWNDALYWQWGTPPWGLAWGCESVEIDQNYFNGTKEDFTARYGVVTEEPVIMNQWYEIIVDKLNIRSQPFVQNDPTNVVNHLIRGDRVEASTVSGSWRQVVKIIRTDDEVEVPPAVCWCNVGTAYCLPVAAPEPGLPDVLVINGVEYRKA